MKIKIKQKVHLDVSMILLCAYILFGYICQKTLLPTTILSASLYVFIVWNVFRIFREGKARLKTFTQWQLAMVLYSALSMLWGIQAETGTLYTMFVSLVLTFCLLNTVDSLRKVEQCMLTYVVASVVMGVLLVITGQIRMDLSARLGEEITGNANSFAALLMVAAMYAGWFAVYRTGWLRVFCLASLVLLYFMMGLSGGRKVLIVVMLNLVWYIMAKDMSRLKKIVRNIALVFVVLAAAYKAVMEIPVLYELIGSRFENLFLMILSGEGVTRGDQVRKQMVQIGLERWLDSPLVGYGLNTFKYYNAQMTGYFFYAHNNYVELLYDLGLVGLVLYYGFYVYVARVLWHLRGKFRQYKILGLGILGALLVYDVGGISFYTVLIQVVLSLVSCMATVLYEMQTDFERTIDSVR